MFSSVSCTLSILVFVSLLLVILAAPTLKHHTSEISKRYEQSALSATDWNSYRLYEPEGHGTYAFGYDVEDPDNTQFRHEERHQNGTVTGSYGYVTPDGNVHIVNYIADTLGYRANVETKDIGKLKPIKVNPEEENQAIKRNYAMNIKNRIYVINNDIIRSYLVETNYNEDT